MKKIQIEVEIFDDPEFCMRTYDDGDFYCDYFKETGGLFMDKCLIFNTRLESYTKCRECLIAYHGIGEEDLKNDITYPPAD